MDERKIIEIILKNYDLVDEIRSKYFDMANKEKLGTFMKNVKKNLKKDYHKSGV